MDKFNKKIFDRKKNTNKKQLSIISFITLLILVLSFAVLTAEVSKSKLTSITDLFNTAESDYPDKLLWSGDVSRWAFRHIVKKADLIILGTVKSVDFRLSSIKDNDDVELPHTFVTYQIEKIVKGKTATDTITLRFQGGKFKNSEGEVEYLISSIIPFFDVGDRDILFLKKNGMSMSPLIGGNSGRYRIIEGEVYSDLGNIIALKNCISIPEPFLCEDILVPTNLYNRLLKSNSEIDKKISSLLKKETIEAIQKALQTSAYSREGISARTMLAYDFNIICGYGGQKPPVDAKSPIVDPLEIIPKQLIIEAEDNGLVLREKTKKLLNRNRDDLSYSEKILLNRFILEDVYYPHLLFSLEEKLVSISFGTEKPPSCVLDTVMKHDALGIELKQSSINSSDMETKKVLSDIKGYLKQEKAIRINEYLFMNYLIESVQTLHTKDELEKIPPMISVSPDQPFYVRSMRPVEYIEEELPDKEDADIDIIEKEALIKSGYNPVLKY